MSDELKHYGTPRHSGRYPWGSGENPYQRYKTFSAEVKHLKSKGLKETEIAEHLGMNTKELRARVSVAKDEIRKEELNQVLKLKDRGWSNTAIGEKLGISEGTVRNYLKPNQDAKIEKTMLLAKNLEDQVKSKGYIDIGSGTERYLGESATRLSTAAQVLKDKGYVVTTIKVRQMGTGQYTNVKVLAPPDTTPSEIYKNKDKIQPAGLYLDTDDEIVKKIEKPRSIASNRVKINYAEDGGIEKDGVIELRRGVEDLSLGKARYAQVRIAVDGTHYLKGMAIYSDNIPDGVDVVFNTNKSKNVPKMEVLKPMKDDPSNPFGATIRREEDLIRAQKYYIDKNGKKQLSALNIVSEEGNWSDWSSSISSQVLSKQSPVIAKKQLEKAYNRKNEDFETIMSLTNPTVKIKLLEEFADNCDSAAVHLKAAGFPRQSWNVILPFPDMRENEIYAPNYRDGERVALIRYPHGGKFEIPELVVNNRNRSAIKTIGKDAIDAVGINSSVAERLSGADFDGDTVLVIPNNSRVIKSEPPLKGLKNFDPKIAYKAYDGMPEVGSKENPFNKGLQMGDVSNLITDMTIKGASASEIERAVKHSMVVIDAKKHNLDWRRSAVENGIRQLKIKYQGVSEKTGQPKGASTLISKASSEERVPTRKIKRNVNKMTPAERKAYEQGQIIYEYTYETYTKKTKGGKIKEYPRQLKSTKMAEVSDANKLSSGSIIETVYATHANKLKALANTARKEARSTPPLKYSPSAKQVYSKEVASLNAKLNTALKNAPLERKAQLLANHLYRLKLEANPNMEKDDKKKARGLALVTARERVGAGKDRIKFTDREWEAIQSGAISNSKLRTMLNNSDMDYTKKLALPKNSVGLTANRLSLAKSRINAGYTIAEVADSLGVSASTLSKALR
jgi:predicted transcriptional regulator